MESKVPLAIARRFSIFETILPGMISAPSLAFIGYIGPFEKGTGAFFIPNSQTHPSGAGGLVTTVAPSNLGRFSRLLNDSAVGSIC